MTAPLANLPACLVGNAPAVDALERLERITGFVTTVSIPDDRRPVVFNRLDHLRRVEITSRAVMGAFRVDPEVKAVREIVWLHDLNRWPFAHNLERGRYDQPADLPRFLGDLDVDCSATALEGMRVVHAWDWETTDDTALVGLAADKIAGLLEDALFAVCGLNVSPEYLTSELWDLLGLAVEGGVPGGRWAELCIVLNRDGDVETFRSGFLDTFEASVAAMVDGATSSFGRSRSGLAELIGEVRRLRDDIIAPRLFPLNNDGVCRRPQLEETVFAPIFADDQPPPSDELLRLDESSVVQAWAARPEFAHLDLSPSLLMPDIDFISRLRPDIAFLEL